MELMRKKILKLINFFHYPSFFVYRYIEFGKKNPIKIGLGFFFVSEQPKQSCYFTSWHFLSPLFLPLSVGFVSQTGLGTTTQCLLNYLQKNSQWKSIFVTGQTCLFKFPLSFSSSFIFIIIIIEHENCLFGSWGKKFYKDIWGQTRNKASLRIGR